MGRGSLVTSPILGASFVPLTLGTFNSSLTLHDNDPSQVQVVNLSGSSFDPFGLSASSLQFGSIAVSGTSAPQNVTLTNQQNQPISVLSITTSGDYAQTNDCPSSLAAGRNCVVHVVFHPTASTTVDGALSFSARAGSNQSAQSFSIPLSGTGTGGVISNISVKPATIDFGNLGDNSNGGGIVKSVTVTNTSSSTSLTFQGISLSPSSYFIIQSNNCTGMLAPGTNCQVQLTNAFLSDGGSPLLPQKKVRGQ